MKDLRVEQISKSIGIKQLFANISFAISAGEHIGLIGQNGTGKSTLLKILAGIEHADSGIMEHAKDFRIAYLPQEPEYDDEQTIFEVVYRSDHPLLNVVRQYELATQKLAQTPNDERIQQLFAHAEQEMTRQHAWDMDVTVRTILKKIGIVDLTKKIKELSGGMKKRVGLAQVLLTEPDLLLLDEPTNHLDVESIKWLEDYLSKYKGALLVITHDRYFLENVVERIFHLTDRTIQTYVGNYETYVEQRAQREAIQQKMAHKQQRLYSKELEWMRQGAKARTTKQQARIQRFNELKEEVQQQKSDEKLAITLDQQRIGKRVFHIEQASLRIADRLLFDQFSLIVQARDRIGIVGENGVGKSSLLHALAGLIPFSTGTFTVGQTVRIAYYRQTNDEIPVEKPLITYLREYAEEVKQKNGEVASVTTLLEMFLFPKAMHSVAIQTLSGGERRRLYLLKLLMTKPNVLLLDEPTNDLDIDTLTVLEQYIEDFNGAVFIVSHDRYFLDKTVDQLIEIDSQGNTNHYFGTMSEYLEHKKEKINTDQVQPSKLEGVKKVIETDTPKVAKLTYHEKKEWDTLEDRITQLEEDVETIQTNMMQNSHDMVKLQALQQQLDETQQQLERAMLRWEELAQRAE